jgi:hypothetical protein
VFHRGGDVFLLLGDVDIRGHTTNVIHSSHTTTSLTHPPPNQPRNPSPPTTHDQTNHNQTTQTQDTSKDSNPLYAQRLEVTPLFGRGYVAGVDMREQRKHNRYLEALTLKRQVCVCVFHVE